MSGKSESAGTLECPLRIPGFKILNPLHVRPRRRPHRLNRLTVEESTGGMGGVGAGAGDGGTLLQSWALQGRADRANRAGQAGKAGRAGRAKQGREGQRRAWQGRLGRASMAGQTGLAGHGNPAQGKAGGCVMVWCVAWGVLRIALSPMSTRACCRRALSHAAAGTEATCVGPNEQRN